MTYLGLNHPTPPPLRRQLAEARPGMILKMTTTTMILTTMRTRPLITFLNRILREPPLIVTRINMCQQWAWGSEIHQPFLPFTIVRMNGSITIQGLFLPIYRISHCYGCFLDWYSKDYDELIKFFLIIFNFIENVPLPTFC